MAQPYPDLPDVRPSNNRARTARRGPCLVVERKETAASAQSASSSEDYAATAHPGGADSGYCAPRVTHEGARGGLAALEVPSRRVAGVSNLHVVQFPPAFHIRAVETSCNTQPGPRLVTPHKKARPIPAPHRTARGRLSNQTQSEDSNRNELIVITLEFTHEPRSQGQRRSFHPQRR